jgi:nickel transport protein
MTNLILAIVLMVSVWLGFPGAAAAHSVQTDYLISSQSEMDLAVTFSTGEAFEKAPVKIYAPNNPTKPWLEGKTDAQGRFAFKPDPALKGDWRLEVGVVNTGDHGDILTVPVGEKGIESKRISATIAPQESAAQPQEHLSGIRFAVVYGILGGLLLLTRKRLGLFK